MDIKIGIDNIARELTIETESSREEVAQSLREALDDGSVWTITDPKGRMLLVPARKIGYVDLGQEHARRVGFGSLSE